MTAALAPAFTSLALRDQPPPDWADVVVESLPAELVGLSDPAQWAREIFSARSLPPVVVGLMGVRQLLAPLVGASRGTWDVFAVQEADARSRARPSSPTRTATSTSAHRSGSTSRPDSCG